MDAYTLTLALGGAGLAVMAVTGAAHAGGHAGSTGSGHASLHAGDSHAGDHAWLRGGEGVGHALLAFASPRALFSVLVGFGAAGLLAAPIAGGAVRAAIAVAGAVVFEGAIVRPLWNFLFRFASRPAVTLEGALLGDARAASTFDRRGQGLIAIELDGQIVQCLGTLRPDDRALDIRVEAGDHLRVEEVDTARQRCTVSYVSRAMTPG